jgi:hypothetical protein
VTWSLVTAPDEHERCCVMVDGSRCNRPTEFRVAPEGIDEHEQELYSFTCGDHAPLVAADIGPGCVITRVGGARGTRLD